MPRKTYMESMRRWLVPLAATFLTPVVSAGEFVLAERGRPAECTIVPSSSASESGRHAALELQDYVKRITGVELPVAPEASGKAVRIVLDDAYGDDGFRLKAEGSDLFVCGGKRGVLYGVYEILETHGGVGWFSSWRTVVPRRNRFAVPDSLDEEQRPAFELRMTSWRDAQRKNPEFASHLRLNGVDNLPSGEAGAKFGGPPLRFGGGLDISHTFNTILPPSKYFKDHPDWYSEVGGRRIGANGECTQLCLTNPEVLRMVVSNVLERIRKDPSATFYGVSQNDWLNYCTCPGCAAVDKEEESHAGTNVRFVNAVAEAVEREFPGKFIETLAYMYTRKPPKKTRLRHNVVPCLCTIECEFNKPFGVSTNAHNVSFEKDIKGWAEQTRNLFLWDYTTNFRNYLGLLPNVRTLGPNLRFFRDNGVRYMFEQGDSQGRHADFAELKTWLIAKLMWNPDQPVEPLIDRFFDGYYGAAAPYVRRYFEEAQSLGQAPGVKHWGIYDHEASSNVPDAFLVRATNLWAHAARAVKGDDVLAYNVRMGAASPLYMIASRSCADKLAWVTRNPDRYGFRGAQRIIRELMDCQKAAGDIRWIEEEGRNRWRNRTWGRFLSLSDACVRSDSAIIYAEDLMQTDGGAKARIVDDGDALGGKAVWLAATGFDWLVRFPANAIACDPGEEYRLRLRVKVDRKPGGNGEAFWAGVYDGVRRRGCGTFSKKVEEVSQGYQWYEVMTGWRPQQGQYFWAGAGRFKGDGESSAHRGVYVDALEISRRKLHGMAMPAKDTLIAHRGECGEAPENTLPAYRLAVERGFGFECDVYLSKDGRVFTLHDDNFKSVTGGACTNRCEDLAWSEIENMDVGNWGKWKGSVFAGTRPALLEEVLELARDGRTIVVEVKTGPVIVPAIKKVFDSQCKANPGNVMFIAFDRNTCRALKQQMPEYKTCCLFFSRKDWWTKASRPWRADEVLAAIRYAGADGVDFQYTPEITTEELIGEIRKAGYEFHVWTVDRLEDTIEAFRRGAMTVTTNCAKRQYDAWSAAEKMIRRGNGSRITETGYEANTATRSPAAMQ